MLRGRFGQVNEDKQVEWNTEGQLAKNPHLTRNQTVTSVIDSMTKSAPVPE